MAAVQSCKDNSDTKHKGVNIEIDRLAKNDIKAINLDIENPEVVVLENREEYMIGEIKKVISYDESYYILTKEGLFKFSGKGKFISKIGNRGNGHGEYIALNNFCILEDFIYIFDCNREKVIVFDINGRHQRDIADIRSIKFMIDAMPMTSDKIILSNGLNFDNHILYSMWIPSDPLKLEPILETSLSFNGSFSYSNHPMVSDGKNVLLITPFGNKILEYKSESNVIVDSYEINGVGFEVNNNNDFSEILTESIGKGSNLLISIFNTDKFLFANLTKGSIVWNKQKDRGCYLETGIYDSEELKFPFYPSMIKYSDNKSLIITMQASELLNIIENNDKIMMNDYVTSVS